MNTRAFEDNRVKVAFAAFAPAVRGPLMAMRSLIFTAAQKTPTVGPLIETLKWGQPAYLPARPRVGTTIRLGATAGGFALYVHCQTGLTTTFRQLYPGVFRFEGERALLFSPGEPLPEAELSHCVALALTYHVDRRRRA